MKEMYLQTIKLNDDSKLLNLSTLFYVLKIPLRGAIRITTYCPFGKEELISNLFEEDEKENYKISSQLDPEVLIKICKERNMDITINLE